MNARTVGVVALAVGAVIAAQIGAGLLLMGGAMIHEAVEVHQQGGPVALAPAPFVNNFVFDAGIGGPRGQACTREELQAARGAVAPVRECTISGPYTHANLSLFLVHGPDKVKGQPVMPLQAALEQNLAVVHAAPSVDNRANVPLFIQAGDIIKGGTQDRVLPYDYLVPVGSNRLPLTVFCVEAGRCGPRGQEMSAAFQSSSEQLPGKRLQLAARYRHAQGDVWQGVRDLQSALERNVGDSVRSPQSMTSLQLTLESPRLQQAVAAYVDDIAPRTIAENDAIGAVVVINGQIQSADTYSSSGLFRELFPKTLKAGAVAAVAERPGGAAEPPTAEKVQKFLVSCEKGDNCQQVRSDGTLVLRQETERAVLFETCDPSHRNVVLHRSYLVK